MKILQKFFLKRAFLSLNFELITNIVSNITLILLTLSSSAIFCPLHDLWQYFLPTDMLWSASIRHTVIALQYTNTQSKRNFEFYFFCTLAIHPSQCPYALHAGIAMGGNRRGEELHLFSNQVTSGYCVQLSRFTELLLRL